jgi:hypothetical protein
MELTRADGSHTVQFGDESKTGAAAAAATAKLAIHAARDCEKGACSCVHQNKKYTEASQKKHAKHHEHVIPAGKNAPVFCQDQRKISAGSDRDCLCGSSMPITCAERQGTTLSPFGMLIWTGVGENGVRDPMPS